MFCRVSSAAIQGIDGCIIYVEADVSNGFPGLSMVGALAYEVKEASERVRTALRNSDFEIPPKRIVINLSPADIRKEGTAFDLPIAVSILCSLGYIPQKSLEKTVIIGELSLNGDVTRINGILPIVLMAKEKGCQRCIVPAANSKEGAVVKGIDIIGVKNLLETVGYLRESVVIEPTYVDLVQMFAKSEWPYRVDFSEIYGQEVLKRCIEIAVSGWHNMLMIGPPGAGKSMIAKRIPTIMPTLTFEESIEISKIYSVSGMLLEDESLVMKRPFRNPHHTISEQALAGGGRVPKPGEVSLAHYGVLFLDELTEFRNGALEIMRQPLEDEKITINRLSASYTYPAKFLFVGAMNPCQCGYYPDRSRCHCTGAQIRRYIGKISQPLMDRIDITVEAPQVLYEQMKEKSKEETSEIIRKRVERTRGIQLKRYEGEGIYFNSQMKQKELEKYCVLDDEGEKLMHSAFEKFGLTARCYHRILKVARTIADMEGEAKIQARHLSEAIAYRNVDKRYWEI